MSDTNTWVILGASSPIARAFAGLVAARGSAVILAGRNSLELDRIAQDLKIRYQVAVDIVLFDAIETATHKDIVARCQRAAQGMINVFLAFGLMPEQADIDENPELGVQVINATYTGAVSILSHFAPVLTSQQGGHVIALGSVAGDRGRLKNYVYGSAKAGLHTYLQGLRARLLRSGVTVTTVKPGFIDTAMTWGKPGVFLVASPQDCAETCLKWAESGKSSGYFPSFWWIIMTIIKLIPEFIFKRLSI